MLVTGDLDVNGLIWCDYFGSVILDLGMQFNRVIFSKLSWHQVLEYSAHMPKHREVRPECLKCLLEEHLQSASLRGHLRSIVCTGTSHRLLMRKQ